MALEKSHFGEMFWGGGVSGCTTSFTPKVGFEVVVGVLHPFVIEEDSRKLQ